MPKKNKVKRGRETVNEMELHDHLKAVDPDVVINTEVKEDGDIEISIESDIIEQADIDSYTLRKTRDEMMSENAGDALIATILSASPRKLSQLKEALNNAT
jgi:hypothetical protein